MMYEFLGLGFQKGAKEFERQFTLKDTWRLDQGITKNVQNAAVEMIWG